MKTKALKQITYLLVTICALSLMNCDGNNPKLCTGHAVGVITALCKNVPAEQIGYYIITNNQDSILVFDSTIIPEEYGNMGHGIYGIDYEIPYDFSFVVLDSLDKEYMIYEIPISNCLYKWMEYCPKDFKQARLIK